MIRLKRLYANNFKQLQEVELHFPGAARVLVQGKNEAGKSTLFEAVFFALFGAALVTETGARGIEDLIGYGLEKARIELDLERDACIFKIARTIVRGKANVWELDVVRADQPPEEIRGNSAVNKRLLAELGFDGDALLNTCFVEQKKLEKLEGMNRAKREESLAKLLNLDALIDMESGFKIRAEDKQELERLSKRAELAEIQEGMPSCEKELGAVESKLDLIDLCRAVEGALAEARSVQQLDAEICDLIVRRGEAAQRLERVNALKEAMLHVRDARDAADRLGENAQEIERLQAEHAEARRVVDQAPQLQARGQALAWLARALRRLGRVRATLETNSTRAAQLNGAQARLVELDATVAREEEALAQLEALVRLGETRQALADWIAARQAMSSPLDAERTVNERRAARDRLSGQFRIEVYGLAVLLLIFATAAVLMPAFAPGLIALAIAALVIMAVRMTLLWRAQGRAAEALGQAEGEARAQAAAQAERAERLSQVEARLEQLAVSVPETIEDALQQQAALTGKDAGRPLDELRAEQEATRDRVLHARAILGELQQQHAVVDANRVSEELAECQRTADKAGRLLGRWQPRVTGLARQLIVEPEEGAAHRALYQVDAQKEQVQRCLQDIQRLQEELGRRQEQAQSLAAKARESYEQARALDPGAPAWRPSLALEEYNAFGKALRGEYDSLGGEATVRLAREIEGDLGRRQGERETRARNATALHARAKELLDKLGQAEQLSPAPELEELTELDARLQATDLGDEATLRVQHRELVGRLHSLQDRQIHLERDLGLAGEQLDRAACRVEFDEKSREAQVRERAVEIVSLARRRIVQKVLPATMDYMRRILPTLTLDRYHDAQLDNESYKIQVWDERAGGMFKEKNIFSGGTKDQFSLALRLAFALATLPGQRGTAPSFIFLDEPLGSFDDERADALIYLLTEGEIARAFDQIFLISHVHVDERLFTHRIVLENGRVAFTDLPGAVQAA